VSLSVQTKDPVGVKTSTVELPTEAKTSPMTYGVLQAAASAVSIAPHALISAVALSNPINILFREVIRPLPWSRFTPLCSMN
jgi:hypothetical protein